MFRPQGRGPALGRAQGVAGRFLFFSRLAARRFGFGQCGFGIFDQRLQRFHFFHGLRVPRGGVFGVLQRRVMGILRARMGRLRLRQSRLRIADLTGNGVMLRRQACGLFRRLTKGGFLCRQNLCRFIRQRQCGGDTVAFARAGLFDLALFPGQLRDHLLRVAVQTVLALDVMGQLCDAGLERADGFLGAGFFQPQRVALHFQPLQDCACHGFFLALGGQGGVNRFARAHGVLCRAFGFCAAGQGLAQCDFCRVASLICLMPAPIEQQAFGLAQPRANLAVAFGLPGLPRELRQLRGQLINHIADAFQIGFGRAQPQFGFMAALIQTRDPCCFFQNPTPRFGLGVDQLGYLPLPHQCRAMRPGRGIGKQHLHIARAHILAVDLVGAACIARDPAGDVERVRIVEPRRGKAFAIVDLQADFGEMARAARVRSGKDHIFHSATAHGGRAILAHDPAQRFQQIGFAAAIGTNHASQTRMNHQIRGVREALEAVKTQTIELHALKNPR